MRGYLWGGRTRGGGGGRGGLGSGQPHPGPPPSPGKGGVLVLPPAVSPLPYPKPGRHCGRGGPHSLGGVVDTDGGRHPFRSGWRARGHCGASFLTAPTGARRARQGPHIARPSPALTSSRQPCTPAARPVPARGAGSGGLVLLVSASDASLTFIPPFPHPTPFHSLRRPQNNCGNTSGLGLSRAQLPAFTSAASKPRCGLRFSFYSFMLVPFPP